MDEKFINVVLLSVRDLLRLGELQTELAGAADFCATYLRCQLLLMKVPTFFGEGSCYLF